MISYPEQALISLCRVSKGTDPMEITLVTMEVNHYNPPSNITLGVSSLENGA